MVFRQNPPPNKMQQGHPSTQLWRSSRAGNVGGDVCGGKPENVDVKLIGFKKKETLVTNKMRKKENRQKQRQLLITD